MDDARYAIQTLLALPSAPSVIAGHRWADERGRWRELVHCLLDAVISEPSNRIRSLVGQLAFLGLLSVDDWAAEERRDRVRDRAVAALIGRGVTKREAERAARVIGEAADVLQQDFGGRIQKCLRIIGEQALELMSDRFAIRGLTEAEQRVAMTTWLQSVCNLPIAAKESDARAALCKANGITAEELLTTADALDLNVAALDDLVLAWAAIRHRASAPKPAAEP